MDYAAFSILLIAIATIGVMFYGVEKLSET